MYWLRHLGRIKQQSLLSQVKIKTQEKGNKQQFHHCSYEVHNPWEDAMNTPINTSPFFSLSLSNILEMELETLILYTALKAKEIKWKCKWRHWSVFFLVLILLSQAFAMDIWNLVNFLLHWINQFWEAKMQRDKGGEIKRGAGWSDGDCNHY